MPDDLEGEGLRVGVVRSRWNPDIVQRLADGVLRGLARVGVTEIVEESVPGAFEIPLAAKYLAESSRVDAVVCIGAVIRGETTHYELVSENCAAGVSQVQLMTGIPVLFGLVTVEDLAQAQARSQPSGGHNVGEESALGAVEMACLARRLAQ